MRKLKIIGIQVFMEKRKTRLLIGILNKQNDKFIFSYTDAYMKYKYAFPLGPEFPLTQQTFSSDTLFPILEDRIPSTRNPAYPEYCQLFGIDPSEKDSFILLATIGRKGPSCFIFHPIYDRTITSEKVIEYRKFLDFTSREFAAVFEFSQASLNAFERKRIPGQEVLKRLEIILHNPSIALEYISINGGYLVDDKRNNAARKLHELKIT